MCTFLKHAEIVGQKPFASETIDLAGVHST